MFFCAKTQLLKWPGCTYANADQFLGFYTGKACQTGFKPRRKVKGASVIGYIYDTGCWIESCSVENSIEKLNFDVHINEMPLYIIFQMY